ncbi:MAG TPA: dihydrofolate reductase family protein [Myxococcales bacterium]|nr:dihydrofolate reductase family protein [Myxococcales bacterium]
MRRLIVFNQVTVDGYFASRSGDMGWAHQTKPDAEMQKFIGDNASGGGELLFGRVTYEMMQAFWPTPAAMQQMPEVAGPMNARQKIVVSRTLQEPSWQNTRLLRGELVAAVRELKASPGPEVAILGSGSVVAQLAGARLIDEYQVLILPVAIGAGRTMFEGAPKLDLRLTRSRTFGNGCAFLVYEPA